MLHSLRSPRLSDYLWLIGLALLWSSSFVLIKYAVLELPPFSMTVLRLFSGFVTIGLCYIFVIVRRGSCELRRFWQLSREVWWLTALSGAMGLTLPFSLIAWGGTRVDVGTATVLMGVMPLATLLLAHMSLKDERLSITKFTGIVLGFSGLLILSSYDALSGLGDQIFYQLLIFVAAVCYAVNALLMRQLSSYDKVAVTFLILFFGFLLSLPLAFMKEGFDSDIFSGLSSRAWFSSITLGVFQTAIATLIMFRVVYHCGASFFSQINYMIPVLGVIWGVLLLGEQLRWNMLVALLFILSGIAVSQIRAKGKSKELT